MSDEQAARSGAPMRWSLRSVLLWLTLSAAAWPAIAQQQIRFGVLGLFHPKELVLEPVGLQVLTITDGDAAGEPAFVLNGEPGHRRLIFRDRDGLAMAGGRSAVQWKATARDGGAVVFQLVVPGKLRRIYRGRLTIECIHSARGSELLAVVAMDRETAVASIVAAEMNESAPLEALKAQAVATRSFLAAGPRHLRFDFCDTTHCQFLKSPPEATSRVERAVEATRGLILSYRGAPLAAMYSSRCGGATRSLRDVGMNPGNGYPYYAVRCAWCLRHPFTWHGQVGRSAQAPKAGNEGRRIEEARQWGWSATPGSDFTATKDGEGWRLEGHSVGHGVGMCQMGAEGMAAFGAGFRQILAHYYPNTVLIAEP